MESPGESLGEILGLSIEQMLVPWSVHTAAQQQNKYFEVASPESRSNREEEPIDWICCGVVCFLTIEPGGLQGKQRRALELQVVQHMATPTFRSSLV